MNFEYQGEGCRKAKKYIKVFFGFDTVSYNKVA
jgi:hypothetical protein